MPQDVSFFLPFQPRTNPEADRARERHLGWAAGLGLVRGAPALRRYRGWLLTELAATAYPDARGADLDLVTDAVCLGFPLDDQFAGPAGRQPDRAARLCTELAAIPYRAPDARLLLDLPVTRAYRDVWRRSAEGMSPAWRHRAAGHLTRFFRAYVTEALNRSLGVRLTEASYLAVRRDAVGTAPCFDLIERAGHFEVPPAAYWSREVRTLTRCAGDIVLLCNDVHSVEREEAGGDPHNLLLVRQRALRCSRAEAIGHVAALVEERARLFGTVAGRLPGLCRDLRLDAAGGAAVAAYADGLRSWMAANGRWGALSGRYAPEGAPGAGEDDGDGAPGGRGAPGGGPGITGPAAGRVPPAPPGPPARSAPVA
ncbi:terpene synthase family protein [Streptomyces marincola]|uniref:Terpene synthase n=1 Tax=Streptomyces marincola TaxID=2878388 RepID=A0A1W7D239_9ACTN|nr:terpene synthase family protein [Streptomyces marincola]ARQ71141.1 hypothetical protein CAG99_22035 [Streptomyces marincola]